MPFWVGPQIKAECQKSNKLLETEVQLLKLGLGVRGAPPNPQSAVRAAKARLFQVPWNRVGIRIRQLLLHAGTVLSTLHSIAHQTLTTTLRGDYDYSNFRDQKSEPQVYKAAIPANK